MDDTIHVEVEIIHFGRLRAQGLAHALLHGGVEVDEPPEELGDPHDHHAVAVEGGGGVGGGEAEGAWKVVWSECARKTGFWPAVPHFILSLPFLPSTSTSLPSSIYAHLCRPCRKPAAASDGMGGRTKACVQVTSDNRTREAIPRIREGRLPLLRWPDGGGGLLLVLLGVSIVGLPVVVVWRRNSWMDTRTLITNGEWSDLSQAALKRGTHTVTPKNVLGVGIAMVL